MAGCELNFSASIPIRSIVSSFGELMYQYSKPANPNLPKSTSVVALIDYLEVLFKYKKMIFIMTTGAAVCSIVISLLLPNIYTAKAMILPSDDDTGLMGSIMAQMGGVAAMAGSALGTSTKSDLYVTILGSETVSNKIVNRFKLMEVYNVDLIADAYKALEKHTEFNAGKKDGVITISVDDTDPKRAAIIANAYMEELEKLATRLGMDAGRKNREFLDKRIAEAKIDLSRAEDALKNFQKNYKIVSLTDQAKATIEGIAQLKAQLAAQEVQLGTLQGQYTDSSQEVKGVRLAISNLKRQIAQLEGIGGNSSFPSVGSVPQLTQEYVRLMRDFRAQEAVFELLSKQYEMSSLSELKDFSSLQIIQNAQVPDKKSKPRRSFIVVGASFAAFVIAVFAAFFVENFSSMPTQLKERWSSLLRKPSLD